MAIAALKGDKTLADLAQQYNVPTWQISDWKIQLLQRAVLVFAEGDGKSPPEQDVSEVTSPTFDRLCFVHPG